MEVTSHCTASDVTDVSKDPNQSECIISQPTANGTLTHHQPTTNGTLTHHQPTTNGTLTHHQPTANETLTHHQPTANGTLTHHQPTANETLTHHVTEEAPPPLSHRLEDDSSDDSLTDSCYTNDISRLLPAPPTFALHKQRGVDGSSVSPVCTPPSSSTCSRHQPERTNQKQLCSAKSHASFKTDAAHIKEVAGDDCCVHCLLACLFCELLSMCSAVGECLSCGVGGVSCCDATIGCCCCVEVAGEAACTEEACQAVLDCGILEDCCGSSDCLEICLECCSICFPS